MNTPSMPSTNRSRRRRTSHTWLALAGALLGLHALPIQAQAPSVVTDHGTYFPGEEIVATFANGPGNPLDWVGVYQQGETPGGAGTFSTLWNYVGGTQTAGAGLTEGQVTFPGGLVLAGDWAVYLFLNDGYTALATNKITVLDPTSARVRTDKRTYVPGEPITVSFVNGPAYPKDWIGIYPASRGPGNGDSLLWVYLDGTTSGTTGKSEGAVTFATGLQTTTNYVAYLLQDDGYTVLASESFTVAPPPPGGPRVLSVYPRNGAVNLPPVTDFLATVTNGVTQLVPSTVILTIDGTKVTHQFAEQDGLVRVAYTNDTLLPPSSVHAYKLTFADNGSPAITTTTEGSFTVAPYHNVALPAPLYFEDFNATPEGQLPTGWTQINYTDLTASDATVDFGNLDSAAYETWDVVNASRFEGPLVGYSRPDETTLDYRSVLAVNPLNVVNGQFLRQLTTGRLAFANSGYRNGRSQVAYLFTPDFNLSGKTDVFLSFHSLWLQNQDSLAAVEYSIDQGATWLPIVYLLDDANPPADVVRLPDGTVDAVATLTTARADIAVYTDPNTGEDKGGTYGAFIGAPISQDLAPYISGRINDDTVESKRVELFRLAQADGQAKVRFRFAHAGADSWYFGIDDFGLYSIPPLDPPKIDVPPADQTVTVGDVVRLTVLASGTPPRTYQWFHKDQPIPDATSETLSISYVKTADAGSYFVRVSNAAGSKDSTKAMLTVNPHPPSVTGAWDFDQGNLAPTTGVGSIEYADAATSGLSTFETTDGTAVPHINGQPAKVMRVPAFTDKANGYALTMPTQPNGGGGYVNRYTMVFDLLIPGSINWTPLFNTSPGNGNDADFYVSDTGALGIGALGYSPAATIAADVWYRVAFTADLGAGIVTYYVNGEPVRVRTGASLLEGRFALYSDKDSGPDVRLFNEPSGGSYTHELLVNSFMFTDRRMSAEEIKALGGPSAAGIPADVSAAPLQLSVTTQGTTLMLSWTGGAGPYQVQKTTSLNPIAWQNVGTPTAATSYSETTAGPAAFYRVVGQ